MRALLLLLIAVTVAGCEAGFVPPSSTFPAQEPSREAAQQFVRVVSTVEPVAEAMCRQQSRQRNCDFLIAVDDTPGAAPNAHQFLSRSGQPVIAFTYALIETVQNEDELAFVMGHEAAHHIAGHLAKQEASARHGAQVLGQIAARDGATRSQIVEAREIGAVIGARRYSKEFELEADSLGTIITKRAGYDPVRGAQFFNRLPDPGNQFLGTHPPNAQRLATVRRAAASL